MQANLNRYLSRRVLFSISGGLGHFHPLVPLAQTLKEAGHEVAFAVGPSLRPLVEASGFAVFPVGGNRSADREYRQVEAQRKTMPLGLETELFIYSRLFCGIGPRLRTPELVQIGQRWQPHILIREAGEYGAVIAAEHLGVPHAAVSFAASLKGLSIFEREAAKHLDPIRRRWGLESDPTLQSPYRYLFLAYSPPSFGMQEVNLGQPMVREVGEPQTKAPASAATPIPSTTHFIRPQFFDRAANNSLPNWASGLSETGRPTVYATLGTEVNKEPGVYPVVLQTIIEGLRDLPVNLVVTVGRDKDPLKLGPQPPNVHIERYIPQSLLLPHCALTVIHGGSNSLLQAVDAGLPAVVVPLIADQFFNGEVAQSLQLGRVVQTWEAGQPGQVELGRLTPARIRAEVEEVLANPAYRQNVLRLRDEMHALPGQSYAVELVEKVASEYKPALNTRAV